MLQEFNEMVLGIGNWINTLLSFPSKSIPLITPNVVLVIVSILIGYLMGRKSAFPKVVWMVLFSIMVYCTIKFIGGA